MSISVDINSDKQLGCMFNVQENLSEAQSKWVAGPLIFSPGKAVVSLGQFVLGLIASIITGIGFLLTCCHKKSHEKATDLLSKSLSHTKAGAVGFGSSVANMVTLGIFGRCVEGKCITASTLGDDVEI